MFHFFRLSGNEFEYIFSLKKQIIIDIQLFSKKTPGTRRMPVPGVLDALI